MSDLQRDRSIAEEHLAYIALVLGTNLEVIIQEQGDVALKGLFEMEGRLWYAAFQPDLGNVIYVRRFKEAVRMEDLTVGSAYWHDVDLEFDVAYRRH